MIEQGTAGKGVAALGHEGGDGAPCRDPEEDLSHLSCLGTGILQEFFVILLPTPSLQSPGKEQAEELLYS